MDTLSDWFNNTLVQSDIISPLIGAVLGVVFAGFSSAPQGQGRAPSVHTTTIIYKTIYIHHGNKTSGGPDDIWPYLIACGMVLVLTIWGYSCYSAVILGLWSKLLFTCLSFALAIAVISLLKGQFSSWDWAGYVGIPLAALALCLYFISLAQQYLIPGASEAARSYGIRHAWDYYNVLSHDQANWIVFQLVGVMAGVLCTLASAIRAIHYLALMNQRAENFLDPFWRLLVRMTLPASKTSSMIGLLILMAFSWFSLSGYLFHFVKSWN